ncbi:MAG: hypothetical protein JXA11_13215 [Phycisphaerae bacterium]|nr:hypothetical protein [Phycisphaerae bacterium]
MKLILPLAGILTVLLSPGRFTPVRADDPEKEFGAGMTDIGPGANDILHKAFRENAEDMFNAAMVLLTPDQAAKSDANLWLALCTEFNDKFIASVTAAKQSAKQYLGNDWSGDLPDDWKALIRKGKEFTLHLSTVGYAAYQKWGTYAVWMKEYGTDGKAIVEKIKELQKDFAKLDKLLSDASAAVVDDDKNKLKKLNKILKDVQSLEQNTIPNSLKIMEKYRAIVSERMENKDRKPDEVKKEMEKSVENVGKTAEKAADFFPAAKPFSEEWTKNAKQLTDDYRKSYDNFVQASKPLMGDIPEIWSGMTQFQDWKYGEFADRTKDMRKKVELEIIRIKGVSTVD